jgi:hypothetical protein
LFVRGFVTRSGSVSVWGVGEHVRLGDGLMQDRLAALYRRYGSRYVWSVIGAVYVEVLAYPMLVSMVMLARFEGLSVGRFAVALLIVSGATVLTLTAALVVVRSYLRAVISWARGDRTEGLAP